MSVAGVLFVAEPILVVCRLYAKGRVLGFQRGKRNQNPNTSLIQLENVQSKDDAKFYLGKRVAYVYRAKREKNGTRIRAIWGRVTRAHGNSGKVRAQFRSNLPPRSFGASVRVVSCLHTARVSVI